MVAVKTGFSSPSMPGMPAPMQPMGGLPPMPPMGGPGSFPAAPLPAGQTPVPPSMPPMPLAGMPPPPMRPPMAQQGSGANRRRKFGDSLENMLGRNQGLGATAPQQQRMVAPGMPMMRTPTPRPMAMGGEVDIFGYEDASSVPRQTNIAGQPHMLSYINQDEEALLRSFGGSGIAGPGGIPSYAPSEYSARQGSGYTTGTGSSNFDSGYTSSASKRRKKAAKAAALAEAKAAAIQQIKDAEAAALAAQQTPSGKMDFGDEDYTPTSAALNQQLANQGLTNITTNFSPVDYTTTGSNNNFTTAAQADTGVSGAEFVAAGGLGSVDSSTPASPPPVTLGSTEALPAPVIDTPVIYTDIMGNTHSSAAERDTANLGYQQASYQAGKEPFRRFGANYYDVVKPPEGKEMAGDRDRIMATAGEIFPTYLEQINKLYGEVGQPKDPFTYEGIGAIGVGDNRDDTQANLGSDVDVDQSGVGLPSGLASPEGRDDTFVESLFPTSRTPPIFPPSDRGFTPSGTQIAPEAATTTGFKYFPSDTSNVKPPIIREKDDSFAESMFEFTPNPYAVGGGFDITAPRETDEGTRFAYPKDKPLVPTPEDKFGNEPTDRITSYTNKETGKTTVDDPDTSENEAMLAQLGLLSTLRENQANPNVSRDPTSVNAAEAAFLQEALGQMEFNKEGKLVSADPNFLEQVMNKIIRNLTFGMFDPDDPQKREDAKSILDAYRNTGKFIYDGKEMSIDELIEASKGDGIEPAVIGVGDLEGNTVGFDDGTGFRNTKEGTKNILTGDTDVFGGNTNTGNTATEITTGGGDDGGSDGGSDTDVDTGHTVDENGNKVCNQEGYIYNPETKICEPKKEEEEVDGTPGSGIGTGTSGESFDDVLKRVVMAAPDVAPISANVKPMQEGGMVGLNRAADNFLQALAG